VGTAIYYLLVDGSPSRLHRVDADEVFHWYAGDVVELLRLGPSDEAEVVHLGADLAAGQVPQTVIPASWWQGLRVTTAGAWALLGCTVSPGFEFDGFELATAPQCRELAVRFPAHDELIGALASA
jgi:predicted cupin superfamily sugar epimerase